MDQTFVLLFLGQVVSFNLAILTFTVSLITFQGVDAPLTISFFSYLALALVYGGIMLYGRQKLLVPWYWYVPLGFVDVLGNYLVTKAYEYTSITSVTLLDCCVIPWVMTLTWLLLGTRYSLWQFFGAGVCLGGLGLVLVSDYDPGVEGGSNPLFGDILVIGGTVFLAISGVSMEFLIKKKDRVEVLTMVNMCGMLVSILGMATMERKSLESISWSSQLVLTFVGCTISSFSLETLGSFVLKMSGATLFNLSILTSDMWAVLIKIFIYKQQVNWLYYPAYGLVAIGIFIYLKTGKEAESTQVVEDANCRYAEYSVLDEDREAPLLQTTSNS